MFAENSGLDAKSKKNSTDGSDPKDYERCKSWTYRRWAWEFLCHNIAFKKASDDAKNGTDKTKAIVAEKFGLVKFKYYGDVQTKSDGYPTFKAGSIGSWTNLESEISNREIQIYPGQVVIRFKLASDINAEQALNSQIAKAEVMLHKKRAEFEKSIDSVLKKKKPNSTSFVEYLRILDMQAHGIVEAEDIAKHLYQFDAQSLSGVDVEGKIRATRKKIESAQEYSEKLYRYIALKSGKPDI